MNRRSFCSWKGSLSTSTVLFPWTEISPMYRVKVWMLSFVIWLIITNYELIQEKWTGSNQWKSWSLWKDSLILWCRTQVRSHVNPTLMAEGWSQHGTIAHVWMSRFSTIISSLFNVFAAIHWFTLEQKHRLYFFPEKFRHFHLDKNNCVYLILYKIKHIGPVCGVWMEVFSLWKL